MSGRVQWSTVGVQWVCSGDTVVYSGGTVVVQCPRWCTVETQWWYSGDTVETQWRTGARTHTTGAPYHTHVPPHPHYPGYHPPCTTTPRYTTRAPTTPSGTHVKRVSGSFPEISAGGVLEKTAVSVIPDIHHCAWLTVTVRLRLTTVLAKANHSPG